MLSFQFCFINMAQTHKKGNFLIEAFERGFNNSVRCSPSLHSTDCTSVVHKCLVFKECLAELNKLFLKMSWDRFSCDQNVLYTRPIFEVSTASFSYQQLKMGSVDPSLTPNDFRDFTCNHMYPRLTFVIFNGFGYCVEKSLSPNSNCVSFEKNCHEFLKCLNDRRSKCQPFKFVGMINNLDVCQHWTLHLTVEQTFNVKFAEISCTSRKMSSDILDHCDYQNRMCKIAKSCMNKQPCGFFSGDLSHDRIIDVSDWFTTEPDRVNGLIVYRCNEKLGQTKGVSVTYRLPSNGLSKWICDSSIRSSHFDCKEIYNICRKIVNCIEDESVRGESPNVSNISLSLEDCESPLEAARSRDFCVKIPVIAAHESAKKYLKDCTFGVQSNAEYFGKLSDAEYVTNPQQFDTFCCHKNDYGDYGTSMAWEGTNFGLTSLDCSLQEKICDGIMACYSNFESKLKGFLELFDTKVVYVVDLCVCSVGVIIAIISIHPKMNNAKMNKFLRVRLGSEILLYFLVIAYISIFFFTNGDRVPKQVFWVRDGILKWAVFVSLTLQSQSTIMDCIFLALMTKYPLMVKEIEQKISHLSVWGIPLSFAYHIPRFFLDVSMSSSLCSLYHSEKLMHSYTLEFQILKQTMVNETYQFFDPTDFFNNFHLDCHSYYMKIRSSYGFFVYNVVLDSVFCHLVPISLVALSMVIFVVEIRKVIHKRKQMNFAEKGIRIFNPGTKMFIIQSIGLAIRHVSMIFTSIYIWFHDNDNIFLKSTLEEQFHLYIVISVLSISMINLLRFAVFNLG